MIQTNGESQSIHNGSSHCDHSAAASLRVPRETPLTDVDGSSAPRRYSDGGELPQGRSGESSRSANYQSLANWGYSIIWAAGEYCQAHREERDVTFRWNGERWIEL